MKINMLSEEIKSKAEMTDIEKLRNELKQYTEQACRTVETNMTKIVKEKFEMLHQELTRHKSEFDTFK